MIKEFADVIDWLRSPEGEKWSHEQMPAAGAFFACEGHQYYRGFFSVKPDDMDLYCAPMWWGDLPGDRQLAAEAARGESAHAV